MSGKRSQPSLPACLGNPGRSASAEARHGFGATAGDCRNGTSTQIKTRDGGCFFGCGCWFYPLEFICISIARHKLTDKDTIVLADFANTTGDPVFDGTLRQGLAVQLEQSPFLSLISEGRMQAVLRLMGQPRMPSDARDCSRHMRTTGSAAVLAERSPALEASMFWACARRIAALAMFWWKNSFRLPEKKMY